MINYDPRYVALRLMAWDHAMPLAGEIAGWTGSSSMAKTGFDPCVVPLLVDMKANGGEGMVIVDSAVICNYLVRLAGGALMPTEPRQLALVQKHIALVDDAPHPALLYDALPAKDLRPAYLKHLTAGGGLHLQQIRNSRIIWRRRARPGTTRSSSAHTRPSSRRRRTHSGRHKAWRAAIAPTSRAPSKK